MSFKKAVRKRSNWYIYLLTFMITFVILSFVIYNIRDYLFPARNFPVTSGSSMDIRPDASFNSTTLLMLSENKGGIPEYYMLLNYRPRDEVILLVPLRTNLYATAGNVSGTLNDVYRSSGSGGVMAALRTAVGVECDHYIKFDKSSFIGFVDSLGTAPVNIPYNLTGEGGMDFYVGPQELSGEALYNYITYPDFNNPGEDYRYTVQGTAISNLINKNSRNLSVIQLQTLFNKILNTTDTSLEFADFTKNQHAYLYTTQNSFNIADYYIPSGTTDEAGYFNLSENAVATIWDRFGMREQ
ncbi:MAG: LCP family protein [Oscillospiraceae bacterium]|nr:LCP family protein [Oscillospiraceae bacterium]